MKSAYSPVSRPTTVVLNLLVKASSCSSIVPSWTRGSTAVTPGGRSHAAAVRRGEGLSVHMCPHPPDSTSRQLKTRSIPSGRRQNVRAAIYWTRGKFFVHFCPLFVCSSLRRILSGTLSAKEATYYASIAMSPRLGVPFSAPENKSLQAHLLNAKARPTFRSREEMRQLAIVENILQDCKRHIVGL